jgi:bile acid:Na+ symporter, BASS family
VDLATLIPIAIRTSVFLVVFALGLGARLEDALYLFRRPAQLARSLLAMNVIMPVVAASLAAAFDLYPAVKIALLALAVSPLPPILPRKQLGAGGREAYTIGLLVAAAVLAIVFMPVTLYLLGRAFGIAAHMPVEAVLWRVSITVLAPLAAGILVRGVLPALAERIAGPVSMVATILLVVGIVPIVFTTWPTIVLLFGSGTVVAIAAFVAAGLAAGHLLGGPGPRGRLVLALATAGRHPGVALAIAGANFPAEKHHVSGAIAWYFIVSAILSAVYIHWNRRRLRDVTAVTRSPS